MIMTNAFTNTKTELFLQGKRARGKRVRILDSKFGQHFELVVERVAWGESRVFFLEPGSGKLKSLPTAWTSRATPDPFLHLAAGRTILRLVDLRALAELLHELRGIERASSS